jgi:transposase
MRKIREVLRLKLELGLTDQQVAHSVTLARSTVQNYISRAQQAQLSWPLPADLDDDQLNALLFRTQEQAATSPAHAPDWGALDRELRRKGVTRQLLWEEYRRAHPEGWQYATFNERYRKWKAASGLSLRQLHRAGEKLFVDYAGVTLGITDPATGMAHPGQVFVATLGASDYTYVEVTRTQTSEDWIGSHVRALAFFGGVPEIIVPDNLKAGVTHASHYEPELNRAYAEFAEHYGVAVIPARVRKPKDKALVEVHVQIAERRLLAPLRDRVFFSLSDANEALWALLNGLNEQPFQKRSGTRRSEFEAVDQPALRSLPGMPFEVATWQRTTVGLDYHVTVQGHAYSVPHQYAKTVVDIRRTTHLVEIFRSGQRMAVHQRAVVGTGAPRQTTVADHLPAHHRQYRDQTQASLLNRAQQIGPATLGMLQAVFDTARHLEQNLRVASGILHLERRFEPARLEAACRRALVVQSFSVQSLESILKHRLDEVALPGALVERPAPLHSNVRGPSYYAARTEPEAGPDLSDLTLN